MTETIEIDVILKAAIQIAKKAGNYILQQSPKDFNISLKEARNVLTEVDLASEKIIKEEIHKKFPNHEILAEESGNNGKSHEYRWIIDPIDGTTNFAHKHPFYAVSIGIEYKNEIIVGVVFAPQLNELFYASKGKGAFLNNQKIKISVIDKIEDSLIATGFPPSNRDQNFKLVEKMLSFPQAIRRCGSASIDMCFVACGRYDGYWEIGLKAWDIAAGKIIVEEAGGKVSNLDGSKINLDRQTLLVSNRKLHKEMLKILS